MKNFLFLLVVFLCGCNSQKTETSKDAVCGGSEFIPILNTYDSSPQIAQYVVEIFEDKKGNLWFGTMEKGAACYDGKELKYYSTKEGMCGQTISSFAEDKEGNIYFGGHTGICKYDGKTFTNILTTSGLHDQGDGWASVQSDKSGNIWVSTNNGVFQLKGTKLVEFKLPIDKSRITSFSITQGGAGLDLEDSSGNLWFGTDGYGILKFNPITEQFTHFTKKDGLCTNNISTIIEDSKGRIWVACVQSSQPEMTYDGGLCRYDGQTFTKFPDIRGLSQNDIYTVYEDQSNNIWIGATGVGVYRFKDEKFTLFNKTDRFDLIQGFGLQGALTDSKGRLWFGFSGGLFRFDENAADGEPSIINVMKEGPWE